MLRRAFQHSASPFVSQHGTHVQNCEYFRMTGPLPCDYEHHECAVKFQPITPVLQRQRSLFKECEETILHCRGIICSCSSDVSGKFWRNRETSVTLFHLGCIQAKNIIRFMKNTGSRWRQILLGVVLRQGWVHSFCQAMLPSTGRLAHKPSASLFHLCYLDLKLYELW